MSKSLLLYGDIGKYDDIQSKDIVPWLMENKDEKVDVHINSGGGDVFEAIAIYNALQNMTDCTMYIDAIAASAAAIIALCGKPLVMGKYAQLMLHSASSCAYGNKKEMEEKMAMLDAIDHKLAAMVAGKMGKKEDEVYNAYFDGTDHWLGADACAEMGFATLINTEEQTEEEKENYLNKRSLVFDCFNGVNKKTNLNPQNNMDIEKFKAVPALSECKDEQEVLDTIAKMSADMEANTKRIAELEGLAQELAELKEAQQKAQDEADAQVIADAVSDGRIADENKEVYASLMKADRENAIKVIASLAKPVVEQKHDEPRLVKDAIKDEPKDEAKKDVWGDYLNVVTKKK